MLARDVPQEVAVLLKLAIIWDYDTAIGMVNASYPYNWQEGHLEREHEWVDRILETLDQHDLLATFAVLGFASEPGHYPYHVPDKVRAIHAAGHEIASHSWRHEWLPFLEPEQLRRTLARSKQALEECIGAPGVVQGFVPPFNRPMTWRSRLAWSRGDRVHGPRFPGSDIGSLARYVRQAGYEWMRVSYTPILHRVLPRRKRRIEGGVPDRTAGLCCLRHSYCGFDAAAQEALQRAPRDGVLVVSGHPSGLGRNREEHLDHWLRFAELAARLRSEGRLEVTTPARIVGTGP